MTLQPGTRIDRYGYEVGGIQYKLNQLIKELLDGGYIKKVN